MSARRKATVRTKKVLHDVSVSTVLRSQSTSSSFSISEGHVQENEHRCTAESESVQGLHGCTFKTKTIGSGDDNLAAKGSSKLTDRQKGHGWNPFFKFFSNLTSKNQSEPQLSDREIAKVLANKFEEVIREEQLHGAKDFNAFRDHLAEEFPLNSEEVDKICMNISKHLFPAEDCEYGEKNGDDSSDGDSVDYVSESGGAAVSEDDFVVEADDGVYEHRDEDYEDMDDSDQFDDEDESFFEPTVTAPCDQCLRNRCSNCLVKIKAGEKKHNKIPSIHHIFDDKVDYVSLEVALICVFDPESPYKKWNRKVERKAEMEMRLTRERKGKTKSSKDAKPKPEKVEKSEAKGVQAQDKEKERELLEVPKSDKVTISKDNGNKDKDVMKKCQDVEGECCSDIDITARMVAEAVQEQNRELSHFYLCSGCAELLSLLFTIWERLEMNLLPVESYFHTVMMAFEIAEKARNVIYHPPKGSTFRVLRRYSKKCHPVGCQKRTNQDGVRINLESGDDFVKQAVGNLISFLHEAYSRVYNEVLKELFRNFLREYPETSRRCEGEACSVPRKTINE
ncbi:unnamed protein product [Orchesella dallaii]|uniref:Uncharacterized protein n=1 Tax=Orchesella dallaii TaxID=48710 RepID=A0ABP1RAB6_9HEXA